MASGGPEIDLAYRDVDPRSTLLRYFLFGAFLISGAAYLAWRATVFNPSAVVFSAAFYVAELIPYVSSGLLLYITLVRRSRPPLAPPPDESVDIFVTTYNEDVDIVRRALVAALRVRYPHETWLLDDGNRAAFAAMADQLGCRYLARSDNFHAKAGNLNNALKYASGDYIVVLDADHCAQPNFIDRVLGYFRDPRVGFVQTPQDYFNTNSFQHGRDKHCKLIWHEQSRFNHVEQPGRDFHNAALLCGCSSMLRRAALDEIGGFAEGTVTEDMHTAVRLMKRGWLPAFHNEPLAYGIAPPDFRAFTRQRLRWAEGNLQVCRLERLPFAAKIGWRANLAYALLTFYYVDAYRKLFFYLAPLISLVIDVPPVYGAPQVFCAFMLPYALISFYAFKEFSGGFGRTWRTEVDAMSRMSAGMMGIWGLFRATIRFRVTPKTASGDFPVILLLPQFLILICGVIVVAYATVLNGGVLLGYWRHGGIPIGISLILIVLVIFHCTVAAQTIIISFRLARPAPANYEHVLSLPLRIRIGNAECVGFSDLLSVEGAVLKSIASEFVPRFEVVDVELFIPAGICKTPARVETAPGADGVRLVFLWPTLAARDELDYALHAGRWHRVVTGRYEMEMTPFERIGLLRAPPTRLPEARTEWRPVLIRDANQPPDPRLAYLRENSSGDNEIIIFKPASGPISIVADQTSKLSDRIFELGGVPTSALLDEAALGCQNGVRRGLNLLSCAPEIGCAYS